MRKLLVSVLIFLFVLFEGFTSKAAGTAASGTPIVAGDYVFFSEAFPEDGYSQFAKGDDLFFDTLKDAVVRMDADGKIHISAGPMLYTSSKNSRDHSAEDTMSQSQFISYEESLSYGVNSLSVEASVGGSQPVIEEASATVSYHEKSTDITNWYETTIVKDSHEDWSANLKGESGSWDGPGIEYGTMVSPTDGKTYAYISVFLYFSGTSVGSSGWEDGINPSHSEEISSDVSYYGGMAWRSSKPIGEAETEPETEPFEEKSVTLKIKVSADSKTPLCWVPVTAYAYYGKNRESEKVDASATDISGKCTLKIPLRDPEEPVHVLLKASLKCIYPYGNQEVLFHFIDLDDSVLVENEVISFGSFISINGEYDTVSCSLSLYDLFQSGSLISGNEPEELYFSDKKTTNESLYDAGTLYAWAFDAWTFGATVWNEQEVLKDSDIAIELNWTQTSSDEDATTVSHYDATVNTIRLEKSDTGRGDECRFTILHEFGHAFDFLTNDKAFRTPTEGENHGGYLNPTTADSYLEGFATFYAAMVQKYSGYPDPDWMGNKHLTNPSLYIAYEKYNSSEEMAIASFLLEANTQFGKAKAPPTDYWKVLDTKRDDFSEYYNAIIERLDEIKGNTSFLKDYAYYAGLFKMPFGDKKYNYGEPFQDLNKNKVWDENEPYGDLMFKADDNNSILDEDGNFVQETIKEFDYDDIKVGISAPSNMIRKTFQREENGYMSVTGSVPDYLLIRVYADNNSYATMEKVNDGRVFIGRLPGIENGRLEIIVPGGKTVYTCDTGDIKKRFSETYGTDKLLDTFIIKESQLAPKGTVACAVYGDITADGVMRNENDEASGGHINGGQTGGTQGNSSHTSGSNSGTAVPSKKDDKKGGNTLVIILITLAILLIVVAVLKVLKNKEPKQVKPEVKRAEAKKPDSNKVYINQAEKPARKAAPTPMAPINTVIRCNECGAPITENAKFCRSCGAKIIRQEANVCPDCKALLSPGAKFCRSCGRKL